MSDNTVTGVVSWVRLPGYSAYCVSGETGDLNMFIEIQSCLIVMTF